MVSHPIPTPRPRTSSSSATPLQKAYPWTTTPFLANAPMGGFANHALATAVTSAGGLGFVGSVNDMTALSTQLTEVAKAFPPTTSDPATSSTLPIGVGFLPFIASLDAAAAVIAQFRPAAVWLFAARETRDYATWTARVRKESPASKIWIQVGSVADAVQVAQRCAPDVLVLQGQDAGGHGGVKGAGIVALLPEAQDALAEKGFGHIPLVAAGGIADGRGVAAALALGAAGVVMGTRFLGARETVMPHAGYRAAVIRGRDGGQSTVRAKVFDELRGANVWPEAYDGRGVRSESYEDWRAGMGIEEIRERFKEAEKAEDGGFGKGEGDGDGRSIVWAGTGLGLVNEIKGAKEIVEEVREAAVAALERASARL